jgi:hypothetical protein
MTEHLKITNSIPGKLRQAVRGPANAVYAEHVSRNEVARHRVSKYLDSTRSQRAFFDVIGAEFPSDKSSR